MEIPTEEAEVIIVYPPSRPGPGSSIYDPNNIIQMAKLMASWGNTVALAVSGAHFFLSSQWGILAGLVPATAPIAGPVAAGHGLAGNLGALAAWGYCKLASHPPRPNYKVDLCKGSIISTLPKLSDDMPELMHTLGLLNETAASIRRFWDSAELWEGAVLAKDDPWIQIHYDNCVQNYRGMYDGMNQLAVATDRCFHESASALGSMGNPLDIRAVFEKKYLGEAYSSIPEFSKAIVFIQESPCAKDVEKDYWKDFASKKIADYSPVQLRLLVAEINRFSKELHLPA